MSHRPARSDPWQESRKPLSSAPSGWRSGLHGAAPLQRVWRLPRGRGPRIRPSAPPQRRWRGCACWALFAFRRSVIVAATTRQAAESRADDADTRADAAESALRLLREALDDLPGGLEVYDQEDRLIFYNKRVAELYPWIRFEHQVGLTFEHMLRQSVGQERIPAAGVGVRRSRASGPGPRRLRPPVGGRRWCRHGPGDPAAGLRSLLHDQADRLGYRAGAGRRSRHREVARGGHRGRIDTRSRVALRPSSANHHRAPTGHGGTEHRASHGAGRYCRARRTGAVSG